MAEKRETVSSKYLKEDLRADRPELYPEDMPQLPPGAPDPALYMQGDFAAAGSGSPDPTDYMPQFKKVRPESLLPVSENPEERFRTGDETRAMLADIHNQHPKNVIDPYTRGKEAPFSGDLNHHQYERYYSHGDFKELGFNPYRDNEALYNENSSFWEEMGRASGQWATLAGLGFKDALGFGDLSDTKTAEKYERAMAIGQSSKGGFGGFTTNLFLNSGYTVGIMGELVMEEIGLAVATAASGFTATGATGTLMGVRAARATNKIYRGFKTGAKLLSRLDNLRDANKARSLWTSTKAIGSGILDFANPLGETVNFARNYKKFDKMSGLAKTTAGFASFYKDVRNVRLAFGESALEAGMVQNQISTNLLEEHYRTYGRPPTEEEALKINNTSIAAAKTTHMQNMVAIFYSNKIVFDNLFKGFSPIRKLTTDALVKNAGGKILMTGAKKGSGKAGFEVIEKGFKGFWQLAKNPRTYARNGLNYFKANIAEGLQETAQEVISGSAIDYYTAKHNGTIIEGGYWANVAQNLSKQVSAEGFETFMSGFLMGGLVQGPQKLITGTGQNLYSRFKNGADYAAMKEERITYLNDTVNILNEMYADPTKYFAPDLENMTEQKSYNAGMDEASENGDQKSFHDLKDASVYKHINTALQMGHMDTFIERLQDMHQLNEEEIQETYGMSKEKFTIGIDNTIARAKAIKQRYDLVQDKYESPFNPGQFKKGSEEWTEEALNHKAWQDAQSDLVFMGHSFDRSLERMNSILNEAKEDSGLANTPMSDFNLMFSFKESQNELDQLDKEIEALGEALSPESKKLLKEKQSRRETLGEFTEAMEEYVTSGVQRGEETTATKPLKGGKTSIDIDAGIENAGLTKAYKAYEKYVTQIAKANGDYVFNDALQKSFLKLVDYYTLQGEAKKLNESVNELLDPGSFTRHAGRIAEIRKAQHADRAIKIEAALKAWLKVKDTNELMQLLHAEGMFFDPVELKELTEKGKLPSTFYYVESKEEVLTTSEDFATALDIIKRFVKNVMDIPIPEATGSPYNTKARNKINEDKRTYEDLAEQFGFDPEAASTKVPLTQVLESIINSAHATKREKALASNLLKIADKEETVTFVKNARTPGSYSPTTQSVIDARYSSHNYKNGGMPIEHVILHEEIHRRTIEELANDGAFKKDLTDILNAAIEYARSEEGQRKWGTRLLYGLKNVEELAAEAMSNDLFQAFLADIPYSAGEKSKWANFVDSVVGLLKKIFGRKIDNTALNAAINIITAKIDVTYGVSTAKPITEIETETEPGDYAKVQALAQLTVKGEQPSEPVDQQLLTNYPKLFERYLKIEGSRMEALAADNLTPEEIENINKSHDTQISNVKAAPVRKTVIPESGDAVKITIKTPLDEIRQNHKPLADKLMRLYKEEEATRTSEERNNLNANWSEMSDDQIFNSTGFKSFYKNFGKAIRAFEEYNRAEGRTAEPTVTPTATPAAAPITPGATTGTVPAFINREMTDKLSSLGYLATEIRAMSPGEAQILIEENLTKDEREQMDAAASENQRQELAEQKIKIRQELEDLIETADSIEALNALDIEINNIFMDPNLRRVGEITSEYIQELITAKKDKLALDVDFDKIEIGEVVILNDAYGTKFLVDGKTDNTIMGHVLNDVTKRRRISRDTVKEKIKYKWSTAMAERGITPETEPTAEEETLSNTSLNEVVNNPDATQEMIANAREGADTGWLDDDNINACE